MSDDRFCFYKEHPKDCDEKDFWGQVKRTVNGDPVSQEQIDMIVDAVVKGLDLRREDILLDLCCGNGALSFPLFGRCGGGLGIDFSEYLIGIANKYFAVEGRTQFVLGDVLDACTSLENTDAYSKALCYGSFPYLEEHRAKQLLMTLHNRFPTLAKVFIGNCPDKELAASFFNGKEFENELLNDPSSAIGIWRSTEEFSKMASDCGWKVDVRRMEREYYAAHYRYDVVLSRE